jgi:plastocyanin domain-containing protein
MLFLANVLGITLIALIVWWFWLYQPASKKLSTDLLVVVKNGVYEPARIEINQHQPTQLKFLREDESPCAATLVFPTLDVSEDLAIGKPTLVTLPALSEGVYPFGCQMQMYRGELVVKST